MAGRRLVFLAGNHDHHLVHRDDEDRLETDAGDAGTGPSVPTGPASSANSSSGGCPESRSRSPTRPTASATSSAPTATTSIPHANLTGSRGDRLLTRTLWAIAAGGPEEPTCIEDYESVTTLLTEWLYIAAQMPHGTHAQQNVFRAAQRAGRFASRSGRRCAAPSGWRRSCATAAPAAASDVALPSEEHFDAVVRGEAARQAREQPLAGPAASRPLYPEPTVISRSDPSEHALEAFAQVVRNLGWDREADKIVFAHTHQPLADVRCASDGSNRYWNTGSWIYEPDLGSRQAYARYLRYAWPGTAILIDDEQPQPHLLELLADLNPLNGGPGLPSPEPRPAATT